ncbi:MAG: class I SAM-dependent methyltransferase, partial [Acidimicrobiales bacterium]
LDVLGSNGFSFLARGELAPALRRSAGGSPVETLVRLFLCGVGVDLRAAEAALAPLTVADWVGAEVLEVDGTTVTALLKLRPFDLEGSQWVIPYDSNHRADHVADYVIGVGAASMTLAGMTVRPPVGRCLDLGTGSGIQALFASSHSDQVVATDRNPRAVAFATFTMAVNGIGNVQARRGDLFEPVTGERFGLIVSNPPFVISPDSRFQYRDSGLPGDEICRRIVVAAPAHLEDGGWCQLLANWAHLAGTDWKERLAGWVEGTGCDAWIIQRDVQDVETYAATWLRHDETDPGQEAFGAWMDHYERTGTEAVGSGLITLRRSGRATPWQHVEEVHQDVALPCGDAVAATFARAAWLADVGDDDRALLDAVLVVGDDVGLHESRLAKGGRWVLDEALLRLEHGLRYTGAIDPPGAGLVAGCDGTARLGDLVQRLADAVGADAAEVTPQVMPIVWRLIEQGFLVPTGPPA